ncbi:MAG: DUF1501 domain-containing protein [Verrucomicrobiota bacterium]|nr:DUF1501 domain-containing protein [Verrucomicrobiota bacterium]
MVTRRQFLDRAMKTGAAAALASLTNIPLVMKQALAAESSLGTNGKKLLFIFLRGANDGLNSVIPIGDDGYSLEHRPDILIPRDPGTDYTILGGCDYPSVATPDAPTFGYASAIRLGNGFSALHPSLKFLAPVYNAGDLAMIHRVGYPKQSRSHFDSQVYWETGHPNNPSKEGIFYRTIMESGLAHTLPLTGVSIQSSLPVILRGSDAAMTNLKDPNRYDLLGIPNNTNGNSKADFHLRNANEFPFPSRLNRDLLKLQYNNLSQTLSIFDAMDFSETGNIFTDDVNTDGDTVPYHLFPTTNSKNGGYQAHNNDPLKYVVNPNSYSFFRDLKAAAMVLNNTDAMIAGTRLDGFDTHSNQGGVTGAHANLQRSIGWAIYALRKYFTKYAQRVNWNNLVVVTLSEFGRTTIQNSDAGTDHAEANVMFVAGGGVKGYNKGNPSGVFAGHPNDSIPWVTGRTGSMFGVSTRYLKRSVDYRSVLGKLIRDHLGASQEQLNRIIPGYATASKRLLSGGVSGEDGTQITGELPIV